MRLNILLHIAAMALAAVPLVAALPPEKVEALPPAAAVTIQFSRDIQPILEAACVKCHGKGKAKGGFSLETREALLQSGDSGPAVVPGRSAESYLIELVSGLDPDNVMPQKGSKLTAEHVALLRAWIDQGAPWDEGITFSKTPPLNLTPRAPELPATRRGLSHPIDRLLAPYYQEHKARPGAPVDDRLFLRRACLDLVGLLPTPGETESFLKDRRPDKRERLVDVLLAGRKRFAEHWLTFWNDLLRNDYRGTGYIDGGRKQISAWLYSALATNMPYDRFVAELVNPSSESSEGFVNGITWRGVVNASQTREMQAAQNISQVFLGVNLKCASCHDSFINDWALADAYGMASIYSDDRLEMFECDKPTGRKATAKFLYPELGGIPAHATRQEKQKRLAEILTSPDNGRLTRTVVNRLWQKFMGRGLIEPVDDMEQPAWHPDLLDWLSQDLAAHGHDLKRTMRLILTSRAYQLPAADLPEQAQGEFVFTGPAVRRMNAEQFRDALGQLTGVWYDTPAASVDFSLAWDETEPTPLLPAPVQWIWNRPQAERKAPAAFVYWRRAFTLEALPEEAFAVVACDNSYTLYLNGERLLSGKEWAQPNFADLLKHLRVGENVLSIESTNHTPDDKPPVAGQEPDAAQANPAGLIAYVRLRQGSRVLDFATDQSWQWSAAKSQGWREPGFAAEGWQPAVELGGVGTPPWDFDRTLDRALSTALAHGHVRSSLVAADPLLVALNRPPREQLVTTRNPTATTLQGLEFSNGETLNGILQRGADEWISTSPPSAKFLATELFGRALGRKPNARELRLSTATIGDPVRKEGVEDFLWAVAMLPEFQLIR